MRPELEHMALESAQALLNTVPMGVDWTLIATDAADWADQWCGQLIRGVTATDRAFVGRTVKRFFTTQGMTRGELEESLATMFGEKRASSIAVTEVTRAYGEGQRIVWQRLKDTGFEMEPIWHTNRDELVCPLCGANDGKAQAEGWTADWAPAHVNCRCSVQFRWKRKAKG
jgi:hypothetical protein